MALTHWTIKNDRRKAAKKESSRMYQEGRYNRKSFSTNGAFGQLSAGLYNLCVMGTSARKKSEKKEKQTYEDRADYDT